MICIFIFAFFGVFSHCAYHAVIILHHQVNSFGIVKSKQEAFLLEERQIIIAARVLCWLL